MPELPTPKPINNGPEMVLQDRYARKAVSRPLQAQRFEGGIPVTMTSQEKLFADSAYDCGYQLGYDDGKHDGMADERKQIVAWLRDVSWPHRNDALIAAIEAGEHLK